MKGVYPVYLEKLEEGGYLVTIPDFGNFTEGKDLADAIYMARDAIGILGMDLQENGEEIPKPFSAEYTPGEGQEKTLVDIDFDAYRNSLDTRLVRKNCTIPYYLENAAEQAGLNFSRLLAEAISTKLNIPLKA